MVTPLTRGLSGPERVLESVHRSLDPYLGSRRVLQGRKTKNLLVLGPTTTVELRTCLRLYSHEVSPRGPRDPIPHS